MLTFPSLHLYISIVNGWFSITHFQQKCPGFYQTERFTDVLPNKHFVVASLETVRTERRARQYHSARKPTQSTKPIIRLSHRSLMWQRTMIHKSPSTRLKFSSDTSLSGSFSGSTTPLGATLPTNDNTASSTRGFGVR